MTLLLSTAIPCSLLLSFFFSGMETGLFSLSRLRLRRLVRAGNPQAKLLGQYLEKPEDFLWTILVGNTLANFAAVSLTVVGLWRGLGHRPFLFWAVFLICALLIYVWCDLLPKMVFRLQANRLCLALAGPFKLLRWCLAPLVWVTARLAESVLRKKDGELAVGRLFGNRDELRRVMQESSQELTANEKAMINRVLDLQNRTIGEVMVPLAKVVSVNVETPVSDVVALCRERGLTRLPVWKALEDRRRIVGLINLRTLLYRTDVEPVKPAGQYLGPAVFVNAEDRLEAAMRYMQRNGHRLAVVLGRDRREVGLVSLQDILKALFGEVKL